MRVLLVHRYYWPDTPPYASLLRGIAGRLTEDGHQVEVISTQPSYKPEVSLSRRPSVETVDGARVRRFAFRPDRSGRGVRLLNAVGFPFAVAVSVLIGPHRDVVMCSTAPPVLLGWLTSLAAKARGSRFVYHCMDLHPEIGALSGDFSNVLIRRALARLDVATCRRADAVVVLSTDMRAALIERDSDLAKRVAVLNNFDLPVDNEGAIESPVPPQDPEQLRLAFTGNVGRFQGLEAFIEAVLGPAPELAQVELVLMGEGGAKSSLIEMVRRAPEDRRGRVRFVPHGSTGQARALLRSADLGIVSLASEVIRYAYPSKTATYLSEGLPVLARVEQDTEMVRTLTMQGAGIHVPADTAGIERRLVELVRRPEQVSAMAGKARGLWESEFSANVLLPRWSSLFAGLTDGHSRAGDGDEDVVIIGAPRSGTNMLRDILTSLPEFTTWDCDEINLTWRHGNRAVAHDELSASDARAEVKNYLEAQFDRVRTKRMRRVVEKTCANSLRVPFVREIKPNAKYVFITRDGLDVVPSAMIRWHAPFDLSYTLAKVKHVPPSDLPFYGRRFALNQWRRRIGSSTDVSAGSWWGPKPSDWKDLLRGLPLDEVCMVQWQRCVDQAEAGLAALPSHQVHHIRYESFAADPASELQSLLAFLDVSCDDTGSLVKGVKASSVGRGRASLGHDARRRLSARAGETLERLGYDR